MRLFSYFISFLSRWIFLLSVAMTMMKSEGRKQMEGTITTPLHKMPAGLGRAKLNVFVSFASDQTHNILLAHPRREFPSKII